MDCELCRFKQTSRLLSESGCTCTSINFVKTFAHVSFSIFVSYISKLEKFLLKLRVHHSGKFAPRVNNPLYSRLVAQTTAKAKYTLIHISTLLKLTPSTRQSIAIKTKICMSAAKEDVWYTRILPALIAKLPIQPFVSL